LSGRHPSRYLSRRKAVGEWTPEGRVSETELLNRVILAKALMVYAAARTMHFRTRKEDLEITPRGAVDVMRVAERLPRRKK
jgi:hypothetical protein